MVDRDPIRAVDETTAEVNALDGALKEARKRQREAVRAARLVGMSIDALAKRVGRNRNTISEWCKD